MTPKLTFLNFVHMSDTAETIKAKMQKCSEDMAKLCFDIGKLHFDINDKQEEKANLEINFRNLKHEYSKLNKSLIPVVAEPPTA